SVDLDSPVRASTILKLQSSSPASIRGAAYVSMLAIVASHDHTARSALSALSQWVPLAVRSCALRTDRNLAPTGTPGNSVNRVNVGTSEHFSEEPAQLSGGAGLRSASGVLIPISVQFPCLQDSNHCGQRLRAIADSRSN